MYAIVDIETTGGSAKKHFITEVAVIKHDGEKEVSRYQTLINPGVPIPRAITTLTGIDDEMVADAPRFAEIADELWEALDGSVFVAHNVNFDYSFIREQFSVIGRKWSPKRLCTVRLSRKLLPGMYSYSLGKLAQQLGYHIEHRHRAMGDCEFTAQLFKMLLDRDHDGHIKFALNQRSREATLPPLLNRESFDKLPSTMGVYIFRNQKRKVIYVGKANNLKHRVSDHFRGNTHTGFKSHFAEQITDLEWIECPNELVALLTEAQQIKKYWPPYNNLMKRVTLNWGIFGYQDQNGYGRYSIGRVGKWDRPIVSFRNQFEARIALDKIVHKFTLCARFCDMQEQLGQCVEEVHGLCNKACVGKESPRDYNKRYESSKLYLSGEIATMIIHESGFSLDEQSVILVENGRYKGHGIAPAELEIHSVSEVLDFIATGYDDQDMQSIIRSHIQRKEGARVTILT
ncbi:MAG: exonuclease domain-containing protein [Flavobacteriales bacterium]